MIQNYFLSSRCFNLEIKWANLSRPKATSLPWIQQTEPTVFVPQGWWGRGVVKLKGTNKLIDFLSCF